HEVADDVKAEAGTALRTPGGEERIKHVPLNLLRNSTAVIRDSNLNLSRVEMTGLDQDVSVKAAGEAVSDRVEDEVGQHLPVGARVAVEHDVGGYLQRKRVSI